MFGALPALAETAYVSNEQDDTVAMVDGTAGRLVATISVGRRPRGLGLSPDGRQLYVAAGNDNRIEVLDLAARRVLGALPSGEDPEAFAMTSTGGACSWRTRTTTSPPSSTWQHRA